MLLVLLSNNLKAKLVFKKKLDTIKLLFFQNNDTITSTYCPFFFQNHILTE